MLRLFNTTDLFEKKKRERDRVSVGNLPDAGNKTAAPGFLYPRPPTTPPPPLPNAPYNRKDNPPCLHHTSLQYNPTLGRAVKRELCDRIAVQCTREHFNAIEMQ